MLLLLHMLHAMQSFSGQDATALAATKSSTTLMSFTVLIEWQYLAEKLASTLGLHCILTNYCFRLKAEAWFSQ